MRVFSHSFCWTQTPRALVSSAQARRDRDQGQCSRAVEPIVGAARVVHATYIRVSTALFLNDKNHYISM